MAKGSVPLRRQLLVDAAVQTPILQRSALYAGCGAVYFMVLMFVSASTQLSPNAPWYETLLKCCDEAVYWAPGLMLLGPVIVYDVLTLTNRFAGPVFRLRREMQRLVAGEETRAIGLRDGDYWTDVADLFNELRTEVLELREFKANPVQAGGEEYVPSQEKLFTNDDEDEESNEVAELLAEANE